MACRSLLVQTKPTNAIRRIFGVREIEAAVGIAMFPSQSEADTGSHLSLSGSAVVVFIVCGILDISSDVRRHQDERNEVRVLSRSLFETMEIPRRQVTMRRML